MIWKYDTGTREVRGGPVISPDGKIFVVVEDHDTATSKRTRDELLAINHDGTLAWSVVVTPDVDESK
ncbi:MAG: hypothetical protein ACTSU5_02725 [Promethearchaeota archaeon]